MPTFDFTGPNGQQYTINGPDGATPQEAFKMLQQHLGGAAPDAPKEASSTLGGVAKSLGTGALEGVTGLAGAPADIANLGAKGIDYLAGSNLQKYTQPVADVAGGAALQKDLEKYTGPLYQPKATGEQYARTIGQFLPGLIGGPEGLAARAATRVAAPAVASEAAGQLTQGTGLEPYARVAGAVAGGGLPNAVSRAISPATMSNERAGFVNTLQNEGVTLSAGQQSGSKALKYIESHTGDAPGAGGQATKVNELQSQQLTQAYLRRAGIDAPLATPEALAAHDDALSAGFNSLAAKHPNIPIPGFNDAANKVVDEFKSSTNLESPALNNFINRINDSQPTQAYVWPPQAQNLVSKLKAQGVGDEQIAQTLGVKPTVGISAPKGNISGETYQTIQSQMAKAARSATDPNLRSSLYQLREALNDAVQDGLKQTGNAADADQWLALRRQYRKFLVIERAMSGSSEAAGRGYLTQPQMSNAEKAIYGKRALTQNEGPFSDLSHAAAAVMKPLPQSGTAPRQLAHLIPGIIGAAAVEGPHALLTGGAAVAAPAVVGRLVHSRLGQKYLGNQAGVGLRQQPLRRNLIRSGILGGVSAANR